ncbi:MAG: hypothetical protein EHM42_06365 [Planctomycetaceae bacterium]|nr:MAG: hypothetical protein EHM42_06365 [Planctomycetaceae bacterium]
MNRITRILLVLLLSILTAADAHGIGFMGNLMPAPPWGRAGMGIRRRPFMQNGRHRSSMAGVHPFSTRGNRFGVNSSYFNRGGAQVNRNRGMVSGSRGGHFAGGGGGGGYGAAIVVPVATNLNYIDPVGPARGNETRRQAQNTGDSEENGVDGLNQPLHWPSFWHAWYHGHWPIPFTQAVGESLAHWQNHPWNQWVTLIAEDGPANWVGGSTYYSAGFEKYVNPYQSSAASSRLDYSRPIDTAVFLTHDRNPQALAFGQLSRALDLMRGRDYGQSLSVLDSILTEDPTDVGLQELRALALFGLGRYDEAAETLYSGLSVAPGCDWTTLIFCFGKLDDYNQSMAALREFVKSNPSSAAGQFLLGYHFMTQGHEDAARVRFQRAFEREPRDQVSRMMLELLPDPKSPATAAPPAPVLPPLAGAPPVADQHADESEAETEEEFAERTAREAAPYLGVWNATGADGAPVSLELQSNGAFRWQHSAPNRAFVSDGRFEINGDLMALQFATGALLITRLSPADKDQIVVQPVRSPPGCSGLTFSR